MVLKFCGKEKFPQSFGQLARNYAETVVSTKFLFQEIRWNYGILRNAIISINATNGKIWKMMNVELRNEGCNTKVTSVNEILTLHKKQVFLEYFFLVKVDRSAIFSHLPNCLIKNFIFCVLWLTQFVLFKALSYCFKEISDLKIKS